MEAEAEGPKTDTPEASGEPIATGASFASASTEPINSSAGTDVSPARTPKKKTFKKEKKGQTTAIRNSDLQSTPVRNSDGDGVPVPPSDYVDGDKTPFLAGDGGGIGKAAHFWPAAQDTSGDDTDAPVIVSEDKKRRATLMHVHTSAEKLKKSKRRCVRPLSLLVLSVVGFFVWFLATFPWLYISMPPKEYSDGTFVLQVSACAVQVRRGSKRHVSVQGQTSSLEVSSEPLPLRVLTVKNRKGCLHVPFFLCRKVCEVLVEVPDDSAPQTLHIFQKSDDKTPGLTVEISQVTLNNLKINGQGGNWWDFAGPTLGLSMNQVTVTGDLRASLVAGQALVESCTLRSNVRIISQENSVYILDTPVPDSSQVLPLNWRSVNQQVFVGLTRQGTTLPLMDADPGGAFSQCDSSYYAYVTNQYYDMNKDGFVDTSEFVETVGWKSYWDSLGMCCGSRCPFSSWCDGLGYQVFTLIDPAIDGGGYSDRATFLSTSSLWNRIKSKGGLGAMLVPRCNRRVNAGPSGGSASTTAWTLEASTDGEVRVLLRADAAGHAATTLPSVAQEVEKAYDDCYAANPDEVACRSTQLTKLNEVSSIWCPTERNPTRGLRLLGVYARQLMAEVGREFGDLISTKDAVVIIDVAPSPGVPRTRWMYSSRPVFLSINPATLFTLSAGLLVPELKHYRVHMIDTACDLNFTNYGYASDGSIRYADHDWRLTEMYEQLYFALHSNGLSIRQVGIRGNLVLLREDGGRTKMYEFVPLSQGWEIAERVQTRLDAQMISAIWLSLALGAVWGFMGLAAIWKYLWWLLGFQAKEEKVRQRTLQQLGIDPRDESGTGEVVSLDEQSEGEVDEHPCQTMWRTINDNPLTDPIQLISTLVVDPLRRRYIDGLEKFIVERCILEHKMKRYVVSVIKKSMKKALTHALHPEHTYNKFVYMREFKERLEVFCTQLRLSTSELSAIDMKRYLIMKCGCRIKALRVNRIQGVRWTQNPAPGSVELGPDSKPFDVMKEFFRTHVQITNQKFRDIIDLEDRHGPDGNLRHGLYGMLAKFCREQGCPDFTREQLSPSNKGGALPRVCEKLELAYREIKVQHIYGIKFVDAAYLQKNGMKISYDWYVLQLVTVAVHMIFLLSPSGLILVYMMFAQTIYAQSVALDEDVITWMDILGKYPVTKGMSTMMAPVEVAVVYHIIFGTVTVLYALFRYSECRKYMCVEFVELLYSLLLALHIFATCMTIGIIAAWFVIASLLDPTRFLPYGTAVVVLFAVVKTTHSELVGAATFFKNQMRRVFDVRLRRALNKAQEEIRNEKQDAMALKVIKDAGGDAAKGVRRRRASLSWDDPPEKEHPAGEDEEEEEEIKTASPAELWSLMETDEEGSVHPKEFRKLLERLDLGLSEVQMDQLFACCDLDDNGGITEMEMFESWEFFLTSIMESAARGAGIGTTDIIFTVGTVCISLVLLFIFVFLALQGWYNESSFNSMVQAVIVSFTGKLVKSARQKVAAEGDAEAVKKLVANLAAHEPGGDDGGGGDGGG